MGLSPRHRRTWISVLACAVAAVGAGAWSQSAREHERQALLELALQRYANEALALTLDGKLMGAISLLGLAEAAIKQECQDGASSRPPRTVALLASVAKAYGAQGVFVIGKDGSVGSSWDDSGKSSTGLQVGFRPYFQIAMQGRDNVYAAVSLSREDRALYFAAPVYPGMTHDEGRPIGAVVARSDMARLNRLLTASGYTALLLSPQGVVFASTRPDWLGRLSGPATPQRIAEIRDLRQFGPLYDGKSPRSLSFSPGTGETALDGRRHAMAAAPLNWNDPGGDWQLVLLEDLSQTVSAGRTLRDALAAAFVTACGCLLVLRTLRSQSAQRRSARELERLASAQAELAARQMALAQLTLRMQQASGRAALVQVFLAECHHCFGALQGLVYAVDDGGARLRLAGGYACTAPLATLAFGEGLLGQCAQERRPRIVGADRAGAAGARAWTIHSALGAMSPAALLLAPVLLQNRLLGVLELALPVWPGDAALEQLMAAADLLAINLELAQRAASPGAVPA